LIAQSNSDVKADKKILIVADQRTPYATLKTVFASAAQNGYSDLKLVVAKRE
jgi:biopolymer transport protein ExbD